MRPSLVGAAIGLLASSNLAVAQTYTLCNPLKQTCPADPALGKSVSYDFTKGASSDFTEVGSPTYGSDGVAFTVAKQGDSPLIQSNWYIMFGHVEFVIKTAPGTGIVSSAVLQSDDLDEIDWEWLGVNDLYVQTNYFGKGDTTSYNRGASFDNAGSHENFHTYTIDWTSTQIVWQIDGKTIRVLTPETADTNQYPESPMMVKVGAWAGGDPSNSAGTIQWAGGVTDYSAGPYTMYMKSLTATDYSTGTTYSYSDQSGSWQSITSQGGKINGNDGAESISTVESAPAVTATIDSAPIPFSGTHRQTSSFVTPDIWPWVATATASLASETSDWTYSGSGRVQPPSAASSIPLRTSSSFVSSLASSFLSGLESSSSTPTSTSLSTTSSASHSTATTDFTAITTGATHSLSNVAPTVAAANNMFEVPVAMGALCMLLGGALAMF